MNTMRGFAQNPSTSILFYAGPKNRKTGWTDICLYFTICLLTIKQKVKQLYLKKNCSHTSYWTEEFGLIGVVVKGVDINIRY